jgi:hypothetical protein
VIHPDGAARAIRADLFASEHVECCRVVFWTFTAQINNSILAGRYARQLLSEQEQRGSLPAGLAVQDWWGHEVIYVKRDTRFLLASFGRDGEADDKDYAQLLNDVLKKEWSSNCLWPWSDIVFVDGGPYRACLK